MKSAILSVFSFLSLTTNLFAQTNVSGGIYNDVTWAKPGNPYIIDGNVVVFDGATLKIEPGVVVKFMPGAKITLRGNINAVGTVTDSIHFTSNQNNPASPDYWGLATDVSTPTTGIGKLTMEYIVVEYAREFFDFGWAATNGPYNIKNSRFSNNVDVLKELSASARSIEIYFTNCLFTNNDHCISGGGEDHNVYITNCWFVNNKSGTGGGYVNNCVYTGHTGVAAFLYHEIKNSYIFNNAIGAEVDMHHDTKFMNNQVYNNDIGVVIDRMGVPTPGIEFKGNIICNNTTWNVRYDYIYNIDLTNNCWCSNDSAFIASKIRDGYDDVSFGLAKFDYNGTCTTSAPPPASILSNRAGKSKELTNDFSFYPNPASEKIFITPYNAEVYNVTIKDMEGKQIVFLQNQHGSINIEVSDIPRGIYFLCLSDRNQIYPLKKIVLQ